MPNTASASFAARSRKRAPLSRRDADPSEFSATTAKNEFGRVLEMALRSGKVVITKHRAPKAVLLSLDEYEALAGSARRTLEALSVEFDTLLARLQSPRARAGMKGAFDATPAQLARAAVAGARKRA